ncbi:MAG: hypothetical protein P8Y38_01775 [Deltaproteobacteria bacterium]
MLEIDLGAIFFNQRSDKIKPPVVGCYVHAVGETARVDAAVGGNIYGPTMKGFAQGIPFCLAELFQIAIIKFSFDGDIHVCWYATVFVIVPRGHEHKSSKSHFLGKLFGGFYLVLIMFEDNKLPVRPPARGDKRFNIFKYFFEIGSSAVNTVGILQPIESKNHVTAPKQRTKSLPPVQILNRPIGIAFHDDVSIDFPDIGNNIGKGRIGTEISKIPRESHSFQML